MRAPLPTFPQPAEKYDAQNETQFRGEVEAAFSQAAQSFAEKPSVQTPSALASGDSHNYVIGSYVTTLRVTPDAGASALTGVEASTEGREVRIINVGSTNLTLKHQNAGSSAANRLLSPTGADVVLAGNAVAEIQYDATTARWRIVNVQS